MAESTTTQRPRRRQLGARLPSDLYTRLTECSQRSGKSYPAILADAYLEGRDKIHPSPEQGDPFKYKGPTRLGPDSRLVQFYMTTLQIDHLKKLSNESGRSIAEVVRLLLDRHLPAVGVRLEKVDLGEELRKLWPILLLLRFDQGFMEDSGLGGSEGSHESKEFQHALDVFLSHMIEGVDVLDGLRELLPLLRALRLISDSMEDGGLGGFEDPHDLEEFQHALDVLSNHLAASKRISNRPPFRPDGLVVTRSGDRQAILEYKGGIAQLTYLEEVESPAVGHRTPLVKTQ